MRIELLGTGAGGYRLRVDTDDVDALRFEGLLGAAVTASDQFTRRSGRRWRCGGGRRGRAARGSRCTRA